MQRFLAWSAFIFIIWTPVLVIYHRSLDNFVLVTPLVTLMVFLIGLPIQIYKVWRNESAKDLSFLRLWLGLFATIVWTGYSLDLKNTALLITNIFGTTFGFILLCQYFHYELLKKQGWRNLKKYL